MQNQRLIALFFVTPVLLSGALFCGCSKQKPTSPASGAAVSPETMQRQQQTQKYILQRREQARKNNRSHTAH